MILLSGGPPHLDMYDLKPEVPTEIRSEFKPIPTNVPGIDARRTTLTDLRGRPHDLVDNCAPIGDLIGFASGLQQ